VAQIKAVIGELPTYGYRRVHAILKRQALAAGLKPPNHKRIYRAMKVHGLLLDRHAGGIERRHDGRVAVDKRNRRWCSDGFEIGCDNGERVRVVLRAFHKGLSHPARLPGRDRRQKSARGCSRSASLRGPTISDSCVSN
jgi:transposase InsO family protein